jgi:hypothetical protein
LKTRRHTLELPAANVKGSRDLGYAAGPYRKSLAPVEIQPSVEIQSVEFETKHFNSVNVRMHTELLIRVDALRNSWCTY